MSAATVRKLGYIGFETPDLDRMVSYYTQILDFVLVERTTDEAFLTTSFDHHSVVLRRGERRPRSFVGYEIAEDVADAQRRLLAQGYQVERRSDIAPSTPDVLVLSEPDTGVPIHLFNAQDLSGVKGYTPLRPSKLGHVASWVGALQPVQDFYQELLGFRWSDTIGDFFVFLRCNADHHAANFITSKKYSGLHHVAYEMRDLAHLQTMIDHLAANEYRLVWGPGRHGPGHNTFTYHKDPDGNVIELFTQIDTMIDETNGYFEPRPWHNDFPQRPKTWEVDLWAINSWGPIDEESLDR